MLPCDTPRTIVLMITSLLQVRKQVLRGSATGPWSFGPWESVVELKPSSLTPESLLWSKDLKKLFFPPLSGSPLPGTSSKIEGLFLRCLFYSIGLFVNMAVTHSFDYCSFVMFWDQEVWVLYFFFVQIALPVKDLFRFYLNFRTSFSISVKHAIGILIGFALFFVFVFVFFPLGIIFYYKDFSNLIT